MFGIGGDKSPFESSDPEGSFLAFVLERERKALDIVNAVKAGRKDAPSLIEGEILKWTLLNKTGDFLTGWMLGAINQSRSLGVLPALTSLSTVANGPHMQEDPKTVVKYAQDFKSRVDHWVKDMRKTVETLNKDVDAA